MRIFLFILAFVCLPFVCHAQAKDKGFFMEMNIGYAHTDYHDDSYMLLSPRIGYQFNDRWAAGVKYIGETDNYLQYHTLGGYAQFCFWQNHRWRAFAEGGVTFGMLTDCPYGGEYDDCEVEAGISLGISYSLSHHLNLMLRYLHIGYSESLRAHGNACWGDHKFILDANISRLQIGVQYIF